MAEEVTLNNNIDKTASEKVNLSFDEVTVPNSAKNTKSRKSFAGIILTFLAGLLYTVSVLLVKLLPEFHPFSLSVWRNLAFIFPSACMCLYAVKVRDENIFESFWPIFGDEKDKGEKRQVMWILVICGLLSGLTMILRFYALNFMSLADATVVSFSGPVFAVIFGHFFLNEKCGFVTIPIAVWTLVGVLVILRPPGLTGQSEFSQDTLIGTAISMSSVILVAISYILLRKLRTIHISIVLLTNGIMGLVESLIIAFGFGVFRFPEESRDIILTISMSLISFLGNLTIILALKYEYAGTVSLIRTSDVLFAFLWQIIFLDLIPDLYSYLGAIIIVSGVLLITARSWVSELPDDSRGRKIFGFLLR